MKQQSKIVLAGLGAMMLVAQSAQATLLVYDGFTGYSVASIGGQAANANTVGLSGSYIETKAGQGLSSEQSAKYQASGLSFGSNFTSSGGSLTISAFNTGRDYRASVALSSGATSALTAGSTLYSSFLFKLSTNSSFAGSALQERIVGAPTDSAAAMIVNADGSGVAQPSALYYGSTVASATSSSYTLTAATTYMFLSRFTNVGAAGGGTETVWLFDVASYNSWFDSGAQEDSLATYALSTISNTSSTQIAFSGYAQFRVATGNPPSGESPTHTGVFDELRYATTLNDALAITIPEPQSLAILTLGMLAMTCKGSRLLKPRDRA